MLKGRRNGAVEADFPARYLRSCLCDGDEFEPNSKEALTCTNQRFSDSLNYQSAGKSFLFKPLLLKFTIVQVSLVIVDGTIIAETFRRFKR